jgi:hypothetical protein
MAGVPIRVVQVGGDIESGIQEIMRDAELGPRFSELHEGVLQVAFVKDESFFSSTGGYQVRRSGQSGVVVYYANSWDAFRALGRILRFDGTNPYEGDRMSESCSFRSVGAMIDVSRNAVLQPEMFVWLLRRFALAGVNMVMLYTEDTYELPGRPFFGYMRGT